MLKLLHRPVWADHEIHGGDGENVGVHPGSGWREQGGGGGEEENWKPFQ